MRPCHDSSRRTVFWGLPAGARRGGVRYGTAGAPVRPPTPGGVAGVAGFAAPAASPTSRASTAARSSSVPGSRATRATSRASSSARPAVSVQRVVQRSAGGVGFSLVFKGETTLGPQPPELKVTGSIPVGSISLFAGISGETRRFFDFLVAPPSPANSSQRSRTDTFGRLRSEVSATVSATARASSVPVARAVSGVEPAVGRAGSDASAPATSSSRGSV